MRERLTAAGGEVTPATTARFAEMLQGEQRRYAKVIAEANIKPE